jgi:methionyl-tRNA formyltransferase
MLAPVPAHPRRLAFLGTPEMSVPPLRALVEAGFEVPLAVTRVDKRRGRGSALAPSPVKVAATELAIPVTHKVDDLLGSAIDLAVVVAFGQIIKPHVLAEVPMVNLHFSLLPRWRGAAPVERALLAGDTETGVCLMQVEEGLDTGPVFDVVKVPIGPRQTAPELRAALVEAGTEQLVRCLRAGLNHPSPQQGEPIYAEKVRPEELHLDWSRPTGELDRLVRLGGAWTTYDGRRLKVLAAEPDGQGGALGHGVLDGLRVGTGDGALELVTVQPEGRGPMAAAAWRNGARPPAGAVLGEGAN